MFYFNGGNSANSELGARSQLHHPQQQPFFWYLVSNTEHGGSIDPKSTRAAARHFAECGVPIGCSLGNLDVTCVLGGSSALYSRVQYRWEVGGGWVRGQKSTRARTFQIFVLVFRVFFEKKKIREKEKSFFFGGSLYSTRPFCKTFFVVVLNSNR